jgi:hypothetical protein
MSRAINELCNMAVVGVNLPQELLSSREHCRQLLSDALIEVAVYIKMNEEREVLQSICGDADNPVRKFFKFAYDNIQEIRHILACHGVSDDTPLTKELLDKYRIMDLLDLYAFEDVCIQIEKALNIR